MLASRGIQATIFDRDIFPRDKLCGEFLSGEVGPVLEQVGCLQALLALEPARIAQGRFTTSSGAELRLPLPMPSYGISRRRLDTLLIDHARRCGVQVLEGMAVAGISTDGPLGPVQLDVRRVALDPRFPQEAPVASAFHHDVVALAYGRRSPLDHHRSDETRHRKQQFVGLKLHHRPSSGPAGRRVVAELTDTVEIHTFAGGYVGVSFVEGGTVNVCMLAREAWLKDLGTSQWSQICEAIGRTQPAFARRYEGLEPGVGDAVQAVAQVSFAPQELHSDGCLYLGDASGMIAPLCGNGQTMAMEGAALLAPLLSRALGSHAERRRLSRQWEQAWRRRFGVRLRVGRALQGLLLGPRAATLGLRLARRAPRLVSRLARATR